MDLVRSLGSLFVTSALLLAGCDRGGNDSDTVGETGAGVPAAATAGGGGAESSEPPVVDSSKLLTPEELQRITGMEFKPGQALTSQSNVHTSTYASTDGTGHVSLVVYVQNADEAAKQYAAMPGMKPVEGVGEAAWWSDALETFAARRGDRVLVIEYRMPDGSDLPGWSKEIAEAALARL